MNPWLILRTAIDTFEAFQFDQEGQVNRTVISHLPELNVIQGNPRISSRMEASVSGNIISDYTRYSYSSGGISISTTKIFNLYQFDKHTGQVNFLKNILTLQDTGLYATDRRLSYDIHSSLVTSNDSIFFINSRKSENNEELNIRYDSSFIEHYGIFNNYHNFLYKFDTRDANENSFLSAKTIFDFKQIYGNKMLLGYDVINGTVWPKIRFNNIVNFQSKDAFTDSSHYEIPNDGRRRRIPTFAFSPYNYIRVSPQYEFSCDEAKVTFLDKSDYGLPNTKVTYFSEEVAGSGELIPRGENPTITYNRNGKYLLKVVLKSHEGTYKEIHYDTLRIDQPLKPHTNFHASDTAICAYRNVVFTNTSENDMVHPTKGETWVYTFGDGTTRTLTEWQDTVNHTYTQAGVYTVSLFYSNGYCDSTLVLNRYIRVIDAPKPGFDIDIIQGCAPLLVGITDTVTVNTRKKEFSFDNGITWREVPVMQRNFTHTFDTSGVFWVVQRLYGHTNCITQIDSVQVFVSKGFTTADTSHIFVATWQDVPPNEENWISIQWDCLDETAHSYELKRNNQTVATFTDCNGQGTFEDTEAKANPNLRYRIIAADSCGTETQIGNIGQPIFLQGAIHGQNEWAVIEFSPYADIQHQSGEFTYHIQTFAQGNWNSISQQTAAGEYEDKPLISNEANALEKCYRIVGQNQVQTSISNVLCLPYLPSVILPSAFSPNGDALNEIYRPLTLGIVSYQMEIYNRWGQLVYSGDESQPGWDGNNAPQGVYVVKIQGIDNQHYFHSYVGSVTLVR
jgi:gliding motility-associated-like protein